MIPWARDCWVGEDKLVHFVFCYAGTLTLRDAGVSVLLTIGVVGLVAIGVELVQWTRRYFDKATFADLPSYRDLVWNAAGVVAALVFAWVR